MDSQVVANTDSKVASNLQPNDLVSLQQEIEELYENINEPECAVGTTNTDNRTRRKQFTVTDTRGKIDYCNFEHDVLKEVLYLPENEQEVINNCSDPNLKKVLIANRLKALHLTGMCRNYFNAVKMLENLITKERNLLAAKAKELKKRKLKKLALRRQNRTFATPYFKDANMYPSPKNDDFNEKKVNREHFLIKCTEGRRWSLEERITLLDAVVLDYFKFRKTQINMVINNVNQHLKNEIDESKINSLQAKLEDLEMERTALNKENPKIPPPLDCNERSIDWNHVSYVELRGKRTPEECKAMWNNYVHPNINKSPWTTEENDNIKELVLTYKDQWDVIAKELGTNRSAYLVFVHFKTDLYDSYKRGRFEPTEDTNLQKAVDKCRLGDYIPWSRVTHFFGDRAKYQLYHRYKYYLEPRNIKKGAFTEAEDVLLMYLINTLGKDYSNIAQAIPNRTSVQLRNRYTTYLEKVRFNLGNFSVEEDKTILDHVKEHGESWRALANKLNRCRAHVRQRYLTLSRTLEKNPSFKIEDIPRRKQIYLTTCQVQRHERMKRCLVKLQECTQVPTLKTIELVLQDIARKAKDKRWKVNECTKTYTKAKSKVEEELINCLKITCKTDNSKDNNINLETISLASESVVNLTDVLGGNMNMFMNTVDKTCITREENIILNNIYEKCDIMNCNVAGTSQSSNCDDCDGRIEFCIPPNIGSLALVRGLLLYFTMHDNKDGEQLETSDFEDDAKPPQGSMVNYELQLEKERKKKKFKDVLSAVFKWPGILSANYPEDVLDNEDIIMEKQEIPRKVGRPPKKVYDKVLKMIEAKKKKRQESRVDNENNEDSIENETEVTNKGKPNEETALTKKKRGRPRKEESASAANQVAYIPRRAHVKAKEGTERTNKSNRMPRDVLINAFNNSADDDTRPSSSLSIISSTSCESVAVQNQVNVNDSNESTGSRMLLKKVDPKNDKVLRQLLKEGKIKLIPSIANTRNNNANLNVRKEKTVATYSRKRPLIEAKYLIENKRLCVESATPSSSLSSLSQNLFTKTLVQIKQEWNSDSEDELRRNSIKDEVGFQKKPDQERIGGEDGHLEAVPKNKNRITNQSRLMHRSQEAGRRRRILRKTRRKARKLFVKNIQEGPHCDLNSNGKIQDLTRPEENSNDAQNLNSTEEQIAQEGNSTDISMVELSKTIEDTSETNNVKTDAQNLNSTEEQTSQEISPLQQANADRSIVEPSETIEEQTTQGIGHLEKATEESHNTELEASTDRSTPVLSKTIEDTSETNNVQTDAQNLNSSEEQTAQKINPLQQENAERCIVEPSVTIEDTSETVNGKTITKEHITQEISYLEKTTKESHLKANTDRPTPELLKPIEDSSETSSNKTKPEEDSTDTQNFNVQQLERNEAPKSLLRILYRKTKRPGINPNERLQKISFQQNLCFAERMKPDENSCCMATSSEETYLKMIEPKTFQNISKKHKHTNARLQQLSIQQNLCFTQVKENSLVEIHQQDLKMKKVELIENTPKRFKKNPNERLEKLLIQQNFCIPERLESDKESGNKPVSKTHRNEINMELTDFGRSNKRIKTSREDSNERLEKLLIQQNFGISKRMKFDESEIHGKKLKMNDFGRSNKERPREDPNNNLKKFNNLGSCSENIDEYSALREDKIAQRNPRCYINKRAKRSNGIPDENLQNLSKEIKK